MFCFHRYQSMEDEGSIMGSTYHVYAPFADFDLISCTKLIFFHVISHVLHLLAGGLIYPFGYAGTWRSSLVSVLADLLVCSREGV